MAATGASALDAVVTKPGGGVEIESKWLIHTCWWVGQAAAEEHAVGDDVELGAAVLAAPGAGDDAAEVAGDELGAVADAEHGDAELVEPGVDARGAVHVDGLGPAAEDHAGRSTLGQLGRRDRRG